MNIKRIFKGDPTLGLLYPVQKQAEGKAGPLPLFLYSLGF